MSKLNKEVGESWCRSVHEGELWSVVRGIIVANAYRVF